MGMKVIERSELSKFLDDCLEAEKDINNREENLEKVYD